MFFRRLQKQIYSRATSKVSKSRIEVAIVVVLEIEQRLKSTVPVLASPNHPRFFYKKFDRAAGSYALAKTHNFQE